MNTKYHIDVTPEEELLFSDQPTPTENAKQSNPFSMGVISVVVGLHALVLMTMIASATKATATPYVQDAPKPTQQQEHTQPTQVPTPSPTPTPQQVTSPTQDPKTITPNQKEEWPLNNKQTQIVARPNPTNPPKKIENSTKQTTPKPTILKEYKVKNGDTIYSIAKKFKLKTERLMKLNNIQDASKIKAGQILKFI